MRIIRSEQSLIYLIIICLALLSVSADKISKKSTSPKENILDEKTETFIFYFVDGSYKKFDFRNSELEVAVDNEVISHYQSGAIIFTKNIIRIEKEFY